VRSARDATAVFSDYAQDYDAPRRRLIPVFDEFYGVAVECLRLTAGPIRRVLDLGAGTGLMAAAVLAEHPDIELDLLDGSGEMLALAGERLGGAISAVHVQDMRDPLPDGPYDAIVSALAIHHLEHAEQRRLFAAVHERLRPGGVFIDAEQVAGPSPARSDAYDELWVPHAHAAGASQEETDAARERFGLDRCAGPGSLLEWLREASFHNVDCLFRWWRFAVVAGWRPAA
jgi:tRNA (cmo5U34)-methyltransferase